MIYHQDISRKPQTSKIWKHKKTRTNERHHNTIVFLAPLHGSFQIRDCAFLDLQMFLILANLYTHKNNTQYCNSMIEKL